LVPALGLGIAIGLLSIRDSRDDVDFFKEAAQAY